MIDTLCGGVDVLCNKQESRYRILLSSTPENILYHQQMEKKKKSCQACVWINEDISFHCLSAPLLGKAAQNEVLVKRCWQVRLAAAGEPHAQKYLDVSRLKRALLFSMPLIAACKDLAFL